MGGSRYMAVTGVSHRRKGPDGRSQRRTMIELRTLGGLDLHDAQGRELRVIFAASKRAALLTYLAIATPGAFTAATRCWPSSGQSSTRSTPAALSDKPSISSDIP